MDVILYTTHCPKCEILMAKLNEKEIPYTICEDVITMKALGFTVVPILKANGAYM
jgi:glutaredoxin-related protein